MSLDLRTLVAAIVTIFGFAHVCILAYAHFKEIVCCIALLRRCGYIKTQIPTWFVISHRSEISKVIHRCLRSGSDRTTLLLRCIYPEFPLDNTRGMERRRSKRRLDAWRTVCLSFSLSQECFLERKQGFLGAYIWSRGTNRYYNTGCCISFYNLLCNQFFKKSPPKTKNKNKSKKQNNHYRTRRFQCD